MRKTEKSPKQQVPNAGKKSASSGEAREPARVSSSNETAGFDIDVEDLHSNRDRQAPVSEEIENDPGIFEN